MTSVSGLAVLACVISVHMYGCVDARSTSREQTTGQEREVIDYKVIIKRETRDELEDIAYMDRSRVSFLGRNLFSSVRENYQDHPPFHGRTFRASEPLDPNGPLTQVLRNPFGSDPFQTVNTIFQPVVEEIAENNPSEDVTENDDSNENENAGKNEHTDEIAEETNPGENPTADDLEKDNENVIKAQEYGAQYPYPETTSNSRHYPGHGVGSSQDTGYDTRGNPYQERAVSRRVVVAGSGGSDPSGESGYGTPTTNRRVVVRGSSNGGARSYETHTGTGQDGQTGYDTRTTNRRVVVSGSGSGRSDGYETHTGTGQDGQTGYDTRTTNRRVVVRGSGSGRSDGYETHTGTGQDGQTGYETRTTNRRIVMRGQSGQNGYNTETVTDQRSQSGYIEPETQRARTNGNFPNLQQPEYRSGNDNTTYHFYNRQYPSGSGGARTRDSRTYTPVTGSRHGEQNRGYGTSGEIRGAYYGGEVFVDNNGHNIDANGRHLDSTGRYYDISGRYTNAEVTRTVTYGTSGESASRYTGTSYSGGTGGHGGSGGGYTGGMGGGSGRTSGGGSSGSETVYTRQYVSNVNGGRAVDSYGGTQFYSGGGSSQPQTYDPVSSFISSDPTCPQSNNRVTINGLSCNDAISQLGSFVCYNYERVSTECCERCLQVKRQNEEGCEYGDRSHQCRNIQPSDCYQPRNRQICCSRCNDFSIQRGQAVSGCEYGDLTPRCQTMVAQRPHLCYLPENQRLCCSTCPRLAHREQPDCQWGNQSPELCEPFDRNGRLRINCYLQAVQEVCCSTCKSLRDRMPDNISGCEYGDSPVQFSTSRGLLDCGQYLRQYGVDECDTSQEVATKCCYTCHRYRNRRG